MKYIYRNPILYYIIMPIAVGLWPLLVWAVYLPAAQEDAEEQAIQYERAEKIMMEILNLDSDRRLHFIDSNDSGTEFAYSNAVDRVASLCGITPSKYKLGSGMIITSREQKTQSANVSLKQIDIVTFTRFLSEIEHRWPNLQCERVKLTQKQGLPDIWDIDVEFKYYY